MVKTTNFFLANRSFFESESEIRSENTSESLTSLLRRAILSEIANYQPCISLVLPCTVTKITAKQLSLSWLEQMHQYANCLQLVVSYSYIWPRNCTVYTVQYINRCVCYNRDRLGFNTEVQNVFGFWDMVYTVQWLYRSLHFLKNSFLQINLLLIVP